eukprot:PhM_4_TR18429/c0_g1_i9/m.85111
MQDWIGIQCLHIRDDYRNHSLCGVCVDDTTCMRAIECALRSRKYGPLVLHEVDDHHGTNVCAGVAITRMKSSVIRAHFQQRRTSRFVEQTNVFINWLYYQWPAQYRPKDKDVHSHTQ